MGAAVNQKRLEAVADERAVLTKTTLGKELEATSDEKHKHPKIVRKDSVEFETAQIKNWFACRRDAFHMMEAVFPKSLENDYGARKNSVKLEPPESVPLGIYQDYVEKSIGIACVFFYREGWKEKADGLVANIDWGKVRGNFDVMIGWRGKVIRENLSDAYLAMVAVLSDAMEQLTGVDRNLMLAVMTRETRMDHNYYNHITKDKGICQLTWDSPLFTYVAHRKSPEKSRRELESVMKLVLPEKKSFDDANAMMEGLYGATMVKEGKQGDITLNMIAGALTYRYKYCMNTGSGALGFAPEAKPALIGYHRESVEDYNGSDTRDEYATAVGKYWKGYSKPALNLALVPQKKEAGSGGLAYGGR
jgi:hypothetical protein